MSVMGKREARPFSIPSWQNNQRLQRPHLERTINEFLEICKMSRQ